MAVINNLKSGGTKGGDYDIEVTENDDGTQSLAIVDSDSSIDRNAIIRGLINGGLTEIVIPEGAVSIKSYGFYSQDSLKSVTIPDSVTSIGYSAFMYCRSLTNVTFGENSKLVSIESNAFDSCKSLTSIVIPNGVRTINGYAFRYCNALTSITFDANTQLSISDNAFYDCTGLTKVNYIGSIEGWCNITFKQVYANPVYYAKNLHINNELITKIEIPSTITQIKNYTFQYCNDLTSVTIGSSVTSIGAYSFQYCSSLTSVIIPNIVTSIANAAFQNCIKLTDMTILATTPPTLSNTNAISSATTTIYIPAGTLSAYQSATNWSSFASKFVELEV